MENDYPEHAVQIWSRIRMCWTDKSLSTTTEKPLVKMTDRKSYVRMVRIARRMNLSRLICIGGELA